ncbi:N-6 DNA methylase, partial [Candidatus Micrarchaeota archaeon]|nr:N-6 DNA methylase [Candidatus Micrarchaeota archaeon]
MYYTPRYIVDYIVKNTLGEKLKECKTIEELQKIKVLDPACGSGSFLIRAFDEIYNYYKQKGWQEKTFIDPESQKVFATVKDQIIKNNLFGVDLDSKAVEIAQLNLLLKTTDKKHKLPKLQENIKNGNSLIDDSTITEKAFNWNKEFETIMENGGFDIVIGNPPYVKVEQIKKDEKDYFFKNFSHIGGRLDLYILFLEKASSILKEKGLMSFILPSIWLKAKYGKELRRHILENYSICAFIDFGDLKVFENVT